MTVALVVLGLLAVAVFATVYGYAGAQTVDAARFVIGGTDVED